MNQEMKKVIAARMKPVLKKYDVKGTLSVQNSMKIVLTIKHGAVDFVTDSVNNLFKLQPWGYDINPYHYKAQFSGKTKEFLQEVHEALTSADYYNNTDVQSDYFDTAYYYGVKVSDSYFLSNSK